MGRRWSIQRKALHRHWNIGTIPAGLLFIPKRWLGWFSWDHWVPGISKFHTALQSPWSSRLPGGFGSMYRYRVSGALNTLECLEPTEMAVSLEYLYLTWSIRSDICSDMAQYYIWVEMTLSNYKDYLLLIHCSTHHSINQPSWHWMDPFPCHWLSSTLSCLEWKVSTCKSPVIQASQSFGAKRFA